MMPGVTRRCREKKLNSFAIDLTCQSEFQSINSQAHGDALKLQKHLDMTSDAIIASYQGDHRLCLSQSTVCLGCNVLYSINAMLTNDLTYLHTACFSKPHLLLLPVLT